MRDGRPATAGGPTADWAVDREIRGKANAHAPKTTDRRIEATLRPDVARPDPGDVPRASFLRDATSVTRG
uniref:Uncharacterized protein n=1 Tax=Ralstonia syzygii R24 TaxID=907261 RepID=G3A0U8_9RALS|nr:hypothetical protein RALSY_10800 [Ralstonia syzygii R24]